MFVFLRNTFWIGVSFAHWLILLSAILSLSGAYAYIRDMFRGKSKPNLVTWGLWAVAPLIATGAALSAHADSWATIRIFISGFSPLLILIIAFFTPQSYWKLHSIDFICGVLSIIALIAWLVVGSPILAILLAAASDLLAAIPTLIKAWRYPETETLYTYVVGIFTATIIIPAIPVWNIQNAAFQIYLLIANITLCFVVLRGYFKRPQKLSVPVENK